MFKNIAADNGTTNVFESLSGVLNIAPLKISGQYKFVIDLNGKIWLDDYNERRVELDLTKEILPQIANFLKTKTNIVQTNYVRYGGFQHMTRKYWHIPLYLNIEKYNNEDYQKDTLPKFFCLSRVLNEEITSGEQLQKYGLIIQLYQLDKLGIKNIMDEILSECPDYPVYYNFEDNSLNINGYSITEECWKTVTLNTVYYQSNQPYVDVFDNFILNSYVENNMFFPRFLNFEFEFEYNDDLVPFNNFFGYMSKGLQTSIEEIKNEQPSEQGDRNIPYFLCNIQDWEDYIIWKQEKYIDSVSIEPFYVMINNISTIPSNIQQPQIRFKVNNLSVNDKFVIHFPNGENYFEYTIKSSDIKPDSLYKTMIYVCKQMTKQSGYEFLFSVNERLQVVCKSNIVGVEREEYYIELPSQCEILDRYNKSDYNYFKFRAITLYDLMLSNELPLDVENYRMMIDDNIFTFVERFKFNDKPYMRCVGPDNAYPVIERSHIVEFYQKKESELWKLPELPYLTVNSNLEAAENGQFEVEKYCDDLLKHFEFPEDYIPSDEELKNHQIFIDSVKDFKKRCTDSHLTDTLPYIKDDEEAKEMIVSNIVHQDNVNDDYIRTMMFNSFGAGSCLVPSVINIDKHFTVVNGNVNYNLDELSLYAYHWFLIKGECPDYMKNDIRSLRYFEDKPKLTSRIVRVNTNYCETMFLGVKYRLPLKYEDWQFAVYLDPNNQLDIDRNYKFIVNTIEHRIYLKIGFYLDYNDLIRGGIMSNKPLIDLSLFYGAENSYNQTSDFITGFVRAKISIDDNETLVTTPANTQTKNWLYFDADLEHDPENGRDGGLNIWLFGLKCSDPDIDLRDLFPSENETQEFMLWSELDYNGKHYTYISAIFTVKGIVEIRDNVVWCKDIQCKFFDTEEMFVQRYKYVEDSFIQEWFRINRTNDIISISDEQPNIGYEPDQYMYGDNVKQCLVILNTSTGFEQQNMKLLLPNKTFSLRDDYFELLRNVGQNPTNLNGEYFNEDSYLVLEKTIVGYRNKETQTDPEYRGWKYPQIVIEEMMQKFSDYSFEDVTKSQKLTLFDRNQIWLFIKDYLSSEISFKNVSREQVRKQINLLLVSNLKDYCELGSIPIYQLDDTTDKDDTNSLGYVKLVVNDHDYNSVIWNLLSVNGYENKLVTIDRYKNPGFPYLMILENAIKFQRELYQKNNRIFNEYDTDFGGKNINATGLWDEVSGNVVSSLYCRNSDIKIVIPFSTDVNIRELLESYFTLDDCVINNNKNVEYISKLDENIDEYIIKKYVDYVLTNFYKLDEVLNDFGNRLYWWNDPKNSDIIHFQDQYSYSIFTETLTIIFKRKK